MSFWNLSDGGSAADTGTSYEVATGGNFEPLPDGSKVMAMVENAEWKTTNTDAEFLSIQWTVVKPESVENRKIFQKLWLTDADPSVKDETKAKAKTDKAKRMLAAIDANAGGKLAKLTRKPTSDDIMLALGNKLMVIRLGVYSLDDNQNPGQKITGNWVQAVAPKTEELHVTESAAKPKPQPKAPQSFDLGGEIPF